MGKSIIINILNWNNSEETIECLKSLQNIKKPNFDVVIVDNGSDHENLDDLVNFVEKINLPIKIIRNKENIGFSGGCNTAIKYATKRNADYILFLNNDTSVDEKFLSHLFSEAEKDVSQQIAIFTPTIFFYDNKEKIWFGGKTSVKWTKMHKCANISLYNCSLPLNIQSQKIDFATGCAMFCRVKVLEKMGGFDERFFLYFEDLDLSLKVRKYKKEIFWVKESKIYHKVSQTTGKFGKVHFRYYDARNVLILIENVGPIWIKFYALVWSLYMLGKQFIKIIFNYNRKESIGFARGIFDYYRRKFGIYNYDKNRN